MSEIITEIHSQIVLNYNHYDRQLISLIGVLEGYLYKVSEKHFRMINSKKIEDVTLSELGLIYNSFLYKNKGMNGVCWEYAVYYAIYYNETFAQVLINNAINYLSKETAFERINAILWGGEKGTIALENIKSIIKEDETIWTPNKEYYLKDYIDLIADSFYNKGLKTTLPNDLSGIWKTDLFVKKESSKTWYAVTVKWQSREVKHYEGLSIGVSFEFPSSRKLAINPYPLTNMFDQTYFINCTIPFEYNFGEFYTNIFRYVENMLSHINCNNPGLKVSTFATSQENYIFHKFHANRDAPCVQLIEDLKRKYSHFIETKETNEIIEATDRMVILIPMNDIYIGKEKEKGIKLIPK